MKISVLDSPIYLSIMVKTLGPWEWVREACRTRTEEALKNTFRVKEQVEGKET